MAKTTPGQRSEARKRRRRTTEFVRAASGANLTQRELDAIRRRGVPTSQEINRLRRTSGGAVTAEEERAIMETMGADGRRRRRRK